MFLTNFLYSIRSIIDGWNKTKGDLSRCSIAKKDLVAISLSGPRSITSFTYFCIILVKRFGRGPSELGQRKSSLVPNNQGKELTFATFLWKL